MDLLTTPDTTTKPPEEDQPHGWVMFGCVPKSAAALELVRELVAAIEAGEHRQRRRNAEAQEAFTEAVGRFAADLILAAEGEPLSELACQKNRNVFTDLPVSYREFMAAYDGMMALALFERVKPGSFRRPFADASGEAADGKAFVSSGGGGGRGGFGQCERIRPTEKLRELARHHGIARGQFREHFEGQTVPLELRGPSGRNGWNGNKIPGRKLRIDLGDREATRLREEVEALNAFIAGVSVQWEEEGPPLLGWTRIFYEGTREGYHWDQGGRLYAAPRGKAGYQGKSPGIRGGILLDGEAVVELDIRASHLAIAYALRGQSLVQRMRELQPDVGDPHRFDPYAIHEDWPRPVVKAWVTVAFGKGKHPTKWSKEIKEATLKRDSGVDLRKYPVAKVGEAVLQAHPVLGNLTGITWGLLQFIESQAIIATMQRLNREAIPVLPVHDSIIVPRSAWWCARLVLMEELEKVTGFRPLPPKPSVPIEELPEAPHRTPYPVSVASPDYS